MMGVRVWLVLGVVGLVLLGCGGSSGDGVYGSVPSGGGVSVPGGDGETAGGASGSGGGVLVGSDVGGGVGGFESVSAGGMSVEEFYGLFRVNADLASLGWSSFLDLYVVPGAVGSFEVEGEANQARLGDESGVGDVERSSVVEVESVTGVGGDVVLTACNEVRSVNDRGLTTIHFERERVRVGTVDGDWMVTERELLHTGIRGEATFGCVPSWLAAEAEAAMGEFLEGYVASYADPVNPQPSVLSRLDEDLLMDMERELAGLVDQGARVDDPQVHVVTVLGSDPLRTWRTVAVEVCTTYPEGVGLSDAVTGDRVGPVEFVGGSFKADYTLWFSLPDEGEVVEYRVLDRGQMRPVDSCS
jgi:hypothetical protein